MSRISSLTLIVSMAIMVLCITSVVAQDDDRPYDMSAVEEMEQLQSQQQQQAQAKAQAVAQAHMSTHAHSSSSSPLLNDPMTSEEQSFFSEKDVDAFLQQRETTLIKANQAAQAKAEAQAKAAAESKAAADAASNSHSHSDSHHASHLDAFSQVVFSSEQQAAIEAYDKLNSQHTQEMHQQQLAEFQQGVDAAAEAEAHAHAETSVDADAETEVDAESETEVEADSDSDAETDAESELDQEVDSAVTELESESNHFTAVDDAAKKALRRAEFLAKLKIHDAEKAANQATPTHSFVQQSSKSTVKAQAKAKGKSTSTQPWWTSQHGVTENYHHYRQGVKNSLLGNSGAATNSANSYSLPLGKKISSSRLNQKKQAAVMNAPVEAYPLVPVQRQGASLAFNPYSGTDFHPELAVPAYAPKLPEYMAESQQPFAGAGYYGSGGGQGPHPGSEAFVPLPGVKGKEFGIRAREAWEAHAEQYGKDPVAFHNTKNLPDYPFFPSWSRKSEIGGRPDIFPKPLYNLPQVNREARAAASSAFSYSNTYYPHLNNQITTPSPLVAAATAQAASPVAGIRQAPRLIRQVIGYPRPTAPQSWAGTIPQQFPQPLNSNSFSEDNNYFQLNKAPTLGVPHHPLAGRNIMINQGPDKGMHPIFGGYPQYIPVPVAAAPVDVTATTF